MKYCMSNEKADWNILIMLATGVFPGFSSLLARSQHCQGSQTICKYSVMKFSRFKSGPPITQTSSLWHWELWYCMYELYSVRDAKSLLYWWLERNSAHEKPRLFFKFKQQLFTYQLFTYLGNYYFDFFFFFFAVFIFQHKIFQIESWNCQTKAETCCVLFNCTN